MNHAIEGILAPHRAEVPLEEHVFANEQHLDADGMADRIGVTVPYRTEVQIAERR